LVRYYHAVRDAALRGVFRRPMVLKRYVNGADSEPFFQKRAPANLPPGIETARISYPSGRFADLVVCDEVADLLWAVNLGCIDLNPWPVRADDTDRPDELRVDLDPQPDVGFEEVKQVALVVNDVLRDFGYSGFAKTSGSRGIHVYVRILPHWEFTQVRRAGLALAREVERRFPEMATTAWWKEERHGVFLDYNQNARDRTVASAYSIRPTSDARVSCPIEWEELPQVQLSDFTIETVPTRLRELGDPSAALDDMAYSLEALLELSAAQERQGQGDAPWPPQFPKMEGEPKRVQPSRARKEPVEAEQNRTPGVTRRRTVHPLITIAKAEHKEDALAGLERWKVKHPEAASHLAVDDVLVDSMRGRSATWTRIRINLRHVPEGERPREEPPDPDYDPWAGYDIELYRAMHQRPEDARAARAEYRRRPRASNGHRDDTPPASEGSAK
jgi:bifunctional non-homologous end joining protein LigD